MPKHLPGFTVGLFAGLSLLLLQGSYQREPLVFTDEQLRRKHTFWCNEPFRNTTRDIKRIAIGPVRVLEDKNIIIYKDSRTGREHALINVRCEFSMSDEFVLIEGTNINVYL